MARKRYRAEAIIGHLRTIEIKRGRGLGLAEVCRKLGITEQTYYRWKKEYGGLRMDQAKRLKGLEQGAARLEADPGGLSLENSILKEVAGKLLSPARRREAVQHVQDTLLVSERRACRVVGQCRATQQYVPSQTADEDRLQEPDHCAGP
ncbi:MAG: transposase [Nitrospira sp.]|nr:transposase [Nitrospira sp.]